MPPPEFLEAGLCMVASPTASCERSSCNLHLECHGSISRTPAGCHLMAVITACERGGMNCCGLRSGALRWLQVPFEQLPDLVALLRVLLRGGWAFVSRHEVASMVVGHSQAGQWGLYHHVVERFLAAAGAL